MSDKPPWGLGGKGNKEKNWSKYIRHTLSYSPCMLGSGVGALRDPRHFFCHLLSLRSSPGTTEMYFRAFFLPAASSTENLTWPVTSE